MGSGVGSGVITGLSAPRSEEDEYDSSTVDFADSCSGADCSSLTGGPISGGGGSSRGGGTSRFVSATSSGWLLTSEPGGESLEPESAGPEPGLSDGVLSGFNEGRVGRAPGVPGSVTGFGSDVEPGASGVFISGGGGGESGSSLYAGGSGGITGISTGAGAGGGGDGGSGGGGGGAGGAGGAKGSAYAQNTSMITIIPTITSPIFFLCGVICIFSWVVWESFSHWSHRLAY